MSPRLPTYQRQVDTAPLPGARINPSAPPEAFGRTDAPLPDLRGTLQAGAQLLAEARAAADEEAVLAADTEVGRLQLELTQRATQRRGRDALGAIDEATREFDKATIAIEQRLATPGQKRAFRQSAAATRQRLHAAVMQHADTEWTRQQAETYNASLTLAQEEVVRARTPEERAQFLAKGRVLIERYGTGPMGAGWTAEQLQVAVANWQSGTHGAVVRSFLAADRDLDARAYWEAHRGQIVGPEAAELEKAVRIGSTLGEAQRQADTIIARPGITRTKAFEAARQITDPETRKATEQQLDTEFRRREQAQAEAHDAMLQAAWNTYVEQGRRPPATDWAKFTPAEKEAADRRIRQRVSGGSPETDWHRYYLLKTEAAEDRASFLRRDLTTESAYLNAPELKELFNLQVGMKRGDAEAYRRADGFLTQQQVVTQMYREVEGVNDDRTQDAQDLAAFQQRVDVAVSDFAKAQKRQPSNEEVRTIASGFLAEVAGTKQGWIPWADPKRLFQLTIQDVPAADREAIVAEIQRRGGAVTDREIVRWYQRALVQRSGGR